MTPKNTLFADPTNHVRAFDIEQMPPSRRTLVDDVVEAALSAF